jgi:hypothetical protein
MKKELEATEHSLAAPSKKSHEVRGAEKAVSMDEAKDLDVPQGDRYGADRGALEARPAGGAVRHENRVAAGPGLE